MGFEGIQISNQLDLERCRPLDHGNVLSFVKTLEFRDEIKNKRFDAHNLARLVT